MDNLPVMIYFVITIQLRGEFDPFVSFRIETHWIGHNMMVYCGVTLHM